MLPTDRRIGVLGLGLGLILWGLGLFGAPREAPPPRGVYAFKTYDAGQGLTNPSVNAMTQDATGFLWVGTEDGLFRLEGNRMRRFGTEEGLPDSGIEPNGLAPTLDGGLWVRSSKGAAYWDGRQFRRPSALGHPEFDASPGLALRGGMIFRDEAFRRFLSTGAGAWRELRGLALKPGLGAGWMSGDGEEVALLLGTTLWRELRGGGWAQRELGSYLQGPPGALLKDRKGRYWVRSERNLLRLEGFDGAVTDLGQPMALSQVNGMNLAEDPSGRVWTNTAGSLAWFGEEEARLFGEGDGLPEGGGNVLLVDQEGALWVGGYGVHRQLGNFLLSGFTRRQGLPAHVVWAVARTRDGRVWAGTAGGLAVSEGGAFRPLASTLPRQVRSLAEDGEGNLWAAAQIGEGEAPRLLLGREGRRDVEWVALPGLKAGDSPWALAWDPEGFLWVGFEGPGLYRLRREGGRWALSPEPIPGWAPGETAVFKITRDPEGGLWVVGTQGLAYRRGGTWTTLRKADGLEDDDLISVAGLAGGQAWVAYRGLRGLARVGWRGGHLRVLESLRPPHPLLASPILDLERDARGALWLATSQGLERWDGQRLDRLDRSVGLSGDDCSQNAMFVDREGDLWVGLSVGLAHFKAHAWRPSLVGPRARLLEITDRSGRSLELGPASLSVPYAHRTLTFRYLPIGYRQAERTVYQVRLLGLEEAWRDTTLPEAHYANLAAGGYRFEVRIKAGSGEGSLVAAQDFFILTPWWQTWWFYGLAAVVVVRLAYLGFRWRTRILMQRMVDLEAQVQERTWDLEIVNKAVEEAGMVDLPTALNNRRALRFVMPGAEARSLRAHHNAKDALPKGEDLLFFLVDLDHFKAVNDTYGHQFGHLVLRETGSIPRALCRDTDTVVRWGGEEFLIVAAGADRGTASVIATNLRERLRSHRFDLGDSGSLACTCSVGFAAFPLLPGRPDAIPWEGAVEVADQCLYAAKKSGRDGWVGVYRADAEVPEALLEGFPKDVQRLVDQGLLSLESSFPADRALIWKG